MVRSSDFKFWEGMLPIDEAHSPRLWTEPPADFRQETSNLLPQNHRYSCPSPTPRLRAIIDGRNELTEMIKNVPESSYDLSLKDIVDDQQKKGDKEREEAEEKKVKHKRENIKNTKIKQICRTESMESKVFLLKMFLPVSLGSKKGKVRKCLSERSEKSANKDWWKTIFLAVKHDSKNTIINRSTSDISSNRKSQKKDESRAQRGCLF